MLCYISERPAALSPDCRHAIILCQTDLEDRRLTYTGYRKSYKPVSRRLNTCVLEKLVFKY